MPNWCSNNISITGPKEKIQRLWDQAHIREGLLNALRPMPEGLDITAGRDGPDGSPEQVALELREAENLAKHGAKNWYDWAVNNWGSKWDISLEGLEFDQDGDTATISGYFDSAWSPPVSAISHYGARNEDVKITLDYYEPGMAFVGRYTVEEGVDDDEFYDYSGETSKTIRAAIGDEICDYWNLEEQLAEYEEDFQED